MPSTPATPSPTVPEWLLHHAPLLSLSIACLMPFVLWALNRRTARLDKERADEKAAFKAWQQRVDEQLSSFVPEGAIAAENTKLGQQIADNQGKIKAYHDAAESNYNAIHMRVNALEQHNVSLTLLPGEVSNLKTDHRVLSAKVDTLTNSVEKLGEKQDRHHGELMQAVRDSAYTRGELHGGQRRES